MNYIGTLLAVTFLFSTAGLFAFVWSLSSKTRSAQQHNAEVIFPLDGSALTKAYRAVRTAAKLQSNFVLHVLRHSVASHLAMGGAGAAEIMTALGHRQMETSTKYIHWANDSRKKLAARAAGPALAAMKR